MELKNTEIFAAGRWNSRDFSIEDLDAIVSAFYATGSQGRVPLKFGHDGEAPMKDGQPALGWVDSIWREGNKLMANFVDMPKAVFEMIKQGLYKFVSVELAGNVQAGTRVITWVLEAVALLGADNPAVGILKDLKSLTMASKRRIGLRYERLVTFTRDDTNQGANTMTPEEQRQLDDTKRENDRLKADFAKQQTDLETLKKGMETQAAERKKADAAARRTEITNLFETEIKAERIQPAVRDTFARMSKLTDDDRVLEITVDEAKNYIALFAKEPKGGKKGADGRGRQKPDDGGDEDDEDETANMNADQKLVRLTFKDLESRGVKPTDANYSFEYQRSAVAMMKKNPDLAKEYQTIHESHKGGR